MTGSRLLAVAIVIGAAVLRLYRLDTYPDWLHHDHAIVGSHALHLSWQTLVDRYLGVGGVWLSLTALPLWLLGGHLWVLRLTAALSGTLAVAATYALAREINERTALTASALLATNHVFLLYSRLPYVMDPVGPVMCVAWIGLQGWKGRGPQWWIMSGLLAGLTLWSYWAASLSIPMYVATAIVLAVFRTGRLWQYRWHLLVWALCFVLTAPFLWQTSHVGENFIQGTLAKVLKMDATEWWYRLRSGFGTLIYYPTAGQWIDWTHQPILLRWESWSLVLSVLAWREAHARLLLSVCLMWIFAIVFLGGCLPAANPGEHYHILLAIPPLMILIGAGLAQLRYTVLIVPCVLAMMWVNLSTLWPAVSVPRNCPTGAAAIWLMEHRALECVTLIRPGAAWDTSFAEGPLYAFVRDLKVIDGGDPQQCPVTLVMPGATLPPMPPGHWGDALPVLGGDSVRVFWRLPGPTALTAVNLPQARVLAAPGAGGSGDGD